LSGFCPTTGALCELKEFEELEALAEISASGSGSGHPRTVIEVSGTGSELSAAAAFAIARVPDLLASVESEVELAGGGDGEALMLA